jgi:hypothetical protein
MPHVRMSMAVSGADTLRHNPHPCPQVIFAGTPDQCRQVVETAEPFREALSERGVLLVVLPAYGSGAADAADVPPLKETDLRCVTEAFRSCSCRCLSMCISQLPTHGTA